MSVADRTEQLRRWWIVGGVVVMIGVTMGVIHNFAVLETLIRQVGYWGPIISVGLYVLLSLTPIPSDPLTLLNGALFGWTNGFLISWLGNTAASLVEYFVAVETGNLTQFEKHRDKLPVWIRKFPVESPWFLIFGRLIPGFGGKIVSLMAGVYRAPLFRYVWTTVLVNMIGSGLYVFGGFGILRWLSHVAASL